ncbi:hypothetical protein LEP1GSC127_0140 [Leptospira kirschneri str. 200801925]|nr:hypothetical protein LEP1GSC127_0140 [Leptospira kirschneri str. 200801925]
MFAYLYSDNHERREKAFCKFIFKTSDRKAKAKKVFNG